VGGVRVPGLERGRDPGPVDDPFGILALKPSCPPALPSDSGPVQAHLVGKDHEPEELDPLLHPPDAALARVQRLPQAGQEPGDLGAHLPQEPLVVVKSAEVVHVPEVAADPQALFHEMVQGIQIDVRKELAR